MLSAHTMISGLKTDGKGKDKSKDGKSGSKDATASPKDGKGSDKGAGSSLTKDKKDGKKDGKVPRELLDWLSKDSALSLANIVHPNSWTPNCPAYKEDTSRRSITPMRLLQRYRKAFELRKSTIACEKR